MAQLAKPSSGKRRYLKPLLVLLGFSALCLLLLTMGARLTATRIAHNERAWFEAEIAALIPANLFDNDLLSDKTAVRDADALGTHNPVAVYRARLQGRPTALIINSVAPDGYGGPIQLLVAISYEGKVLGVQVLTHHETPGLGNDFELPGSTWLAAFRGHSLHDPETRGWNVRKDGGDFAQFTSATISPRAIIKAVQRTLEYYGNHREQLFNAASRP